MYVCVCVCMCVCVCVCKCVVQKEERGTVRGGQLTSGWLQTADCACRSTLCQLTSPQTALTRSSRQPRFLPALARPALAQRVFISSHTATHTPHHTHIITPPHTHHHTHTKLPLRHGTKEHLYPLSLVAGPGSHARTQNCNRPRPLPCFFFSSCPPHCFG